MYFRVVIFSMYTCTQLGLENHVCECFVLNCYLVCVLVMFLVQVGFSSLERYYDIVYDQAISPSGNSLAACDSYGQIAIFK